MPVLEYGSFQTHRIQGAESWRILDLLNPSCCSAPYPHTYPVSAAQLTSTTIYYPNCHRRTHFHFHTPTTTTRWPNNPSAR